MSRDVSTETLNFNVPASPALSQSGVPTLRARRFKDLRGSRGRGRLYDAGTRREEEEDG